MWLFEVDRFGPFIVDSDLRGNSLFAEQGEQVNEKIESLYEGLKKPTLLRYGETDERMLGQILNDCYQYVTIVDTVAGTQHKKVTG